MATEEGVFRGTLTWVKDGDGLFMIINGTEMELRLADIDAPERDQPYGWDAKLELIDLVRDGELTVILRDVDHYGRHIASVWVGETYVNRELVARGFAWFYPEFAEDQMLYDVEQVARRKGVGLWKSAQEDRIEPWIWRDQKRAARSRPDISIKRNKTNSRSIDP